MLVHVQAGLRQASDKLAAAQQLLQEIESSSSAQELQLTQQLSSHTQQLAAAQQVGISHLSIPAIELALHIT
jgi:hypothetical protein